MPHRQHQRNIFLEKLDWNARETCAKKKSTIVLYPILTMQTIQGKQHMQSAYSKQSVSASSTAGKFYNFLAVFIKIRIFDIIWTFSEPIQVKDAVLFSPVDKEKLIEILQIDTYEPPMTQVYWILYWIRLTPFQTTSWITLAKLNMLRSDYGCSYTKVNLADNDVYVIPRNVVHQFRSTASVSSIAWHVRLRSFFDPNKGSYWTNSAIFASQWRHNSFIIQKFNHFACSHHFRTLLAPYY